MDMNPFGRYEWLDGELQTANKSDQRLNVTTSILNSIQQADMKQRVISILNQFGVPETAITNQTHFAHDLGLDSLYTVDLIMQFEKHSASAFPTRITKS